jgi:sulfur-carrier protein
MATVTIRYWAAAKHAAGTPEESVDARTLADALDIIRQRHNGNTRLFDVLSISSFLVNEKPVGHRAGEVVALDNNATIEVLPPFAGG